MWFELILEEDDLVNNNAVQIFQAPRNKQEIKNEHYDMTQQDASLPEKRWIKTMQFNEEFSKYKPPFVKMIKQYKLM